MRTYRHICSWNVTAMSRRNAVVRTPFSRKRCRAAKRSATAISSNHVCVTGCHIIRTTSVSARFPTSTLPTHDRMQTNESRSERRFARALFMASRARRSHSHVREREREFAREPTTHSFRTETLIIYMTLTHFQHLAHCLATAHARMPVYTGGMGIYQDDFPSRFSCTVELR